MPELDPLSVFSVFSGAGGIDLGLERAGLHICGQVENDDAPRRILAHHWPDVPLWGDVREVEVADVIRRLGGRPRVMVGGFPCQDLSVAGQRAGMAGERSGLYRELLRLVRGLDPDWLVVENVPGLLSADADPAANGGRGLGAGTAMGLFLGDLTGFFPPVPADGWRNSGVIVGPLGSAAWRVLDAQHFGVAQRRRRVFVVFNPRNRAAPAQILLEPQGLQGNPAPRRCSWQKPAGLVGARSEGDGRLVSLTESQGHSGSAGTSGLGTGEFEPLTVLTPADLPELSNALTVAGAGMQDPSVETYVPADGPQIAHSLLGEGYDASEDGSTRGTPLVPFGMGLYADYSVTEDRQPPLTHAGSSSAVAVPAEEAVPIELRNALRGGGATGEGTPGTGVGEEGAPAGTLGTAPLAAVAYRKAQKAHDADDCERWEQDDAADTLDAGGQTARTATAIVTPLQEVNARTGHSTDDVRAGIGIGEQGDPMFTLQARQQHGIAVGEADLEADPAVPVALRGRDGSTMIEVGEEGEPYNALRAGDGGSSRQSLIGQPATATVRRLTPLECERLMSWPDEHTEPAGSDSARYRACGNGVVSNITEWIGMRLRDHLEVDSRSS